MNPERPLDRIRIAVILTCHNRRVHTLAFLKAIFAQVVPFHVDLQIFLLDDASSDGTKDAVAKQYPSVEILHGNGSLFWCGGMRVAWQHAASTDPDFFLAANDDTLLIPTALSSLLALIGSPSSRCIAVAAIRDRQGDAATYGGWRNHELVPPSGRPEDCDTFNANCVLVSRAVYTELGTFHSAYTHAMGDFDYGFQASKNGIKIIQAASALGSCDRNTPSGTWKDRSLSRRKRFEKLQSPKGLPWKEWVIYNRRNAGWIWPYRCISPFLRILLGR